MNNTDNTNNTKNKGKNPINFIILIPLIVALILIFYSGLKNRNDKNSNLKIYIEQTQAEVKDYNYYKSTNVKGNTYYHIIILSYYIN